MAIETANQILNWQRSLDEMAALGEQTSFLTRLANHANQSPCAVDLARLLETWRSISVRVTIVAKTENGAPQLIEQLAAAFGTRLTTNLIETSNYAAVAADVWEDARKSAAIVCLVPAAAPLFDDTGETVALQFGGTPEKLFLAVVSPDPIEAAMALEVKQALSAHPQLGRATVAGGSNLATNMEPFLVENYLQPLIAAMRALIASSIPRLQPIVNAFGGFLALDAVEFGHRLEYAQRDLEALQTLGKQAAATLQASGQAAISGVATQITSISAAMRQQAEGIIQKAVIAHEVLSNQDLRTRFGQEVTASARAAGFHEFDARVQAIAMNLNSARSLLLSNMDQVREEAEAHLEELRLNLGPELFGSFLQPPLDTMGDRPFNVPLTPGENFAAAVIAEVKLVRDQIPSSPFTSGWASGRIESMFRSEMSTNVTAPWNVQTVDGVVAIQLTSLWQETVQSESGLLVGRITALAGMVKTGLAALRLDALRIPQDAALRARLAAIFAGYTAQLNQMSEIPVTTGVRNPT